MRNQDRMQRVRTIARLMLSNQWNSDAKAELRAAWEKSPEGCKSREFNKCLEAAQIAVESQVAADPKTTEFLRAVIDQKLTELCQRAEVAWSEAMRSDSQVMKARFMDTHFRVQREIQGYLGMLTAAAEKDKGAGLQPVPPEELLRLAREEAAKGEPKP